MGFRGFTFRGVAKVRDEGRPRGEPAVRDGAARERGRRRSAYEAPHGSVAPGPRFQRRRIEAETVPPLPCTAVSGHAPGSGGSPECAPQTAHQRGGPVDRGRGAEDVEVGTLQHDADAMVDEPLRVAAADVVNGPPRGDMRAEVYVKSDELIRQARGLRHLPVCSDPPFHVWAAT